MPSIQLPSGPRARAGAGGRPTLRHACGAEARSVSELRVCTNQTCKRQGSPEVSTQAPFARAVCCVRQGSVALWQTQPKVLHTQQLVRITSSGRAAA